MWKGLGVLYQASIERRTGLSWQSHYLPFSTNTETDARSATTLIAYSQLAWGRDFVQELHYSTISCHTTPLLCCFWLYDEHTSCRSCKGAIRLWIKWSASKGEKTGASPRSLPNHADGDYFMKESLPLYSTPTVGMVGLSHATVLFSTWKDFVQIILKTTPDYAASSEHPAI